MFYTRFLRGKPMRRKWRFGFAMCVLRLDDRWQTRKGKK
jgi:hypothetical protein